MSEDALPVALRSADRPPQSCRQSFALGTNRPLLPEADFEANRPSLRVADPATNLPSMLEAGWGMNLPSMPEADPGQCWLAQRVNRSAGAQWLERQPSSLTSRAQPRAAYEQLCEAS